MSDPRDLAQAPRVVRITSPLGPDVLVLRRLTVRETIGSLFRIEAEVLSKQEIKAQILRPHSSCGNGSVEGTVFRPRKLHSSVGMVGRNSRYHRMIPRACQHDPRISARRRPG